MSKYLVTLGAGTGQGTIVQCASTSATINGKPIAVVGDIASHPYGPDTLIEGVPTVLLNGRPVAFSTGKTAKGGTLLPNTSVKISSASALPLASYTGIVHAARVVSQLVFTDPTSNRELKKQIRARNRELPQECETCRLTSDFAWKQLILLAKSDGLWFFKFRMAHIFGKDVSQKAVNKLYDACLDGSLPQPEIVVCENTIYGLEAAYHTGDNRIYVSRGIVERAIEDNEVRHKLLAALVEEFGHHVDWLLRCHYDRNARQDASGDEGARFAYNGMCRIWDVDFQTLHSVPFAQAQTPEGTFELNWDFKEFHDAIERYTRDRQYGTDDHVGDFEGFKVENLERQNGFGHENIQRQAIQESGVEEIRNTEQVDYLYRGNWLRDYTQLLAPVFFDPKTVIGLKNPGQNLPLQTYYTKIASDSDRLKAILTDVVRVLAIKEFWAPAPREGISRQRFTDGAWRKLVDGPDGLIPGFAELINVSVPYDHCDNPKGLVSSPQLRAAGFNAPISTAALGINRKVGLKHYLRSSTLTKASCGTEIVHTHLRNLLNKIEGMKRPADLCRLGGLLHTVQDFYAHSNFAEISLVKTWSDRVITWCAEADTCDNYADRRVHSQDPRLVLEPTLPGVRIYGRNLGNKMSEINPQNPKSIHKKALYAPVVTGTYDFEDLFATALLMARDKFFALDPESVGKLTELTPGILSAEDLLLLIACQHADQMRANTGASSTYSTEALANRYFDMRDFLIKARKFLPTKVVENMEELLRKFIEAIPGLVPEWIKNIIEENALYQLYETITTYKEIMWHYLLTMLVEAVKEYQLVLKKNMDNWTPNTLGGIYRHGDNPSHTMMAKDEADHPLNGLAGEMAINSSAAILKALKQGKETALETLDRIFVHPVLTERFDDKTREWAAKNAIKVLRSSLYLEQLGNMHFALSLIDRALALINKHNSKPAGIGTNRAAGDFDESDRLKQTDLNQVNSQQKSLYTKFSALLNAYMEGGQLRQIDEQTFAEWMVRYRTPLDPQDAIPKYKKIWRTELTKAFTQKGPKNLNFKSFYDTLSQLTWTASLALRYPEIYSTAQTTKR